MAFAPGSEIVALRLSPERLRELAGEDAAFAEIAVDDRGLTAGAYRSLVQPGRALFARWREARAGFDTAVEPAMPDIMAAERLEGEIAERARRRDDARAQAEQGWEASRRNVEIRTRWEEAGARFRRARLAHGDRAANMRAYNPAYWVAMLCIGVAEWLINYDTFFLFIGVPAIAAGATVVLGVLLALSAHGHGEILKQWSYRFGQHQGRMSRVSTWRLLGLATLGLAIVLLAAGASRYAAALRVMSAQPAANILGVQAVVEVDPLRDVLISLLANLGAWVVGVFLSYLCHDPDPELMDATRQHQRASRAFYRARRGVDGEIRAIEGSFEKEVAEMRRSALARAAAVKAERDMFDQVNKREEGIVDAILGAMRANAEAYRDALAGLVLARPGQVALVRRGDSGPAAPITAHEYRAIQPRLDAGLLRAAL